MVSHIELGENWQRRKHRRGVMSRAVDTSAPKRIAVIRNMLRSEAEHCTEIGCGARTALFFVFELVLEQLVVEARRAANARNPSSLLVSFIGDCGHQSSLNATIHCRKGRSVGIDRDRYTSSDFRSSWLTHLVV
jgi:hypothetical protein